VSNQIEDFLNQILSPYESIIISNPQLRVQLESVTLKYQFEFDTQLTREQLERELKEYITNFIIDNRNKKIDQIL